MTAYCIKECPSCFKRWEDEADAVYPSDYTKEVMCDFCKLNHTTFEMLERQIDVLSTSCIGNFPTVLKGMFNEIKELKKGEKT